MVDDGGHAGDLTPQEAVHLLKNRPDAVLIDVRTVPEWERVGIPDADALSTKPIFLEWMLPPAMVPNPEFQTKLKAELGARAATASTPLLFLCRSGARSAAAADAVTALGYEQCHNIVGGFEGAPAQGREGWKESGLPWTRR